MALANSPSDCRWRHLRPTLDDLMADPAMGSAGFLLATKRKKDVKCAGEEVVGGVSGDAFHGNASTEVTPTVTPEDIARGWRLWEVRTVRGLSLGRTLRWDGDSCQRPRGETPRVRWRRSQPSPSPYPQRPRCAAW